MYEKECRLPAIIRQVGQVKGKDRVYIEDYAYGYLHELKNQAGEAPIRAALYGETFLRDDVRFYLIYGVVPSEDAAYSLFSEYELLGYVNLKQMEKVETQLEGCYVFCENNEAMQEYLLTRGRSQIQETQEMHDKGKCSRTGIDSVIGKLMQKLLLGAVVLIATIAAATINHYDRMREFVVMVAKAAQEIR